MPATPLSAKSAETERAHGTSNYESSPRVTRVATEASNPGYLQPSRVSFSGTKHSPPPTDDASLADVPPLAPERSLAGSRHRPVISSSTSEEVRPGDWSPGSVPDFPGHEQKGRQRQLSRAASSIGHGADVDTPEFTSSVASSHTSARDGSLENQSTFKFNRGLTDHTSRDHQAERKFLLRQESARSFANHEHYAIVLVADRDQSGESFPTLRPLSAQSSRDADTPSGPRHATNTSTAGDGQPRYDLGVAGGHDRPDKSLKMEEELLLQNTSHSDVTFINGSKQIPEDSEVGSNTSFASSRKSPHQSQRYACSTNGLGEAQYYLGYREERAELGQRETAALMQVDPPPA